MDPEAAATIAGIVEGHVNAETAEAVRKAALPLEPETMRLEIDEAGRVVKMVLPDQVVEVPFDPRA